MPAYKDNVHNTWYCMFYFEDWTGQKMLFCTLNDASFFTLNEVIAA